MRYPKSWYFIRNKLASWAHGWNIKVRWTWLHRWTPTQGWNWRIIVELVMWTKVHHVDEINDDTKILKWCRWIWSVFMKLNSIEEIGNVVDTRDVKETCPFGWHKHIKQHEWNLMVWMYSLAKFNIQMQCTLWINYINMDW